MQVNTLSTLDLAEAGDMPLFHNSDIHRRLSQQEIRKNAFQLSDIEWIRQALMTLTLVDQNYLLALPLKIVFISII